MVSVFSNPEYGPGVSSTYFRVIIPTSQLQHLEQYFAGMPERFLALRKQWSLEAANKVKVEWQNKIRSHVSPGNKLPTNWTGAYANSLTVRGNQFGAWISVTGAAQRYFPPLEGSQSRGSKPIGEHMLSQHHVYGENEIHHFTHKLSTPKHTLSREGAVSEIRQRSKYNYYPITNRQASILGVSHQTAKTGRAEEFSDTNRPYMGLAKRVRKTQTVFNSDIGVRGEFHDTGNRSHLADSTHLREHFVDPKTGEVKEAHIYQRLGYHGYGVADIIARGHDSKNRKSFEQANYKDVLGHVKYRPESPHLKKGRSYGAGNEAGRKFYQVIHGKGTPKEQLYMRELAKNAKGRSLVAGSNTIEKNKGRMRRNSLIGFVNATKRAQGYRKEEGYLFDINRLSPTEKRIAEKNLGSGLGGDGTATGRILAWAMARFPQTYKKNYINPRTGTRHRRGDIAHSKSRQNAYRLLRWIRTQGTKPTHIREQVLAELESGTLHSQVTDLAFKLAENFLNMGL